MADKIPTADEFLQNHIEISRFYDDKSNMMVCYSDDVQKAMVEFAKLHVIECKEEIAEKAEVKNKRVLYTGQRAGNPDTAFYNIPVVDKDSILNAYPESNIK